MSLNIKNEEAHALASRLAKQTGETITEAVTQALKERLDRVTKEKKPGLAQRLMKIGEDSAARIKEPYRSISIDELLYDDKGLPK